MPEVHDSFCRFCHAACAIKVTVEDDQAPTSNMRRLSVRARCSSDTAIEDSERPLAAFCPWGVAYRFRDP